MAAPLAKKIAQSCFRCAVDFRFSAAINSTYVRYKSKSNKKLKDPKIAKERALKFERFVKSSPQTKISPVKEKKTEYIGSVPTGDVYFMNDYPPHCQSLRQALKSHREYADPSMFNNMKGKVFVHFELNLAKKNKKTKSKANLKDFIRFPHKFETGSSVRCIVICPSDRRVEALEYGALYAGGDDLLAMLHPRKGTIPPESYDIVLATPDMQTKLAEHKSIFKGLYPTKENGSIGEDIQAMIKDFQNTVFYASTKLDKIGTLQVPFGMLDMSDQDLEENITFLIKAVENPVDPIITKAKLIVPPSPEEFYLESSVYKKDTVRKQGSKKLTNDDDVDDDDDNDVAVKHKSKKKKQNVDEEDDDEVEKAV